VLENPASRKAGAGDTAVYRIRNGLKMQ